MRTVSTALCWTFASTLLPAAALAQDAPWQPEPTAPTVPAPAVPAPTLVATAHPAPPIAPVVPRTVVLPVPLPVRYDPAPGSRYALEGLGGLVGAGAGAAVALVGVGVLSGTPSASLGDALVLGAIAGSVVLFAVPLGVTLVGNARGGNGGYGWSLLGMLCGSLASQLVVLPLNAGCSGSCATATMLGSVLGLAGMLTGAVLGYELSSDQRRLRRPSTPVAVRWVPTAFPTRGGLTLGAAAVF